MRKALVVAIVLSLLVPVFAGADGPAPGEHRVYLPTALRRHDPYAEKRKPQPHDAPAAVAVLQALDGYVLDPRLSGDALSDQLRGMGAQDAYKVFFWAVEPDAPTMTVYNIVVVFWDEGGAVAYLDYLDAKCVALGGAPVTVPPMADGANGCRRTGGMDDICTVNFRLGNVIGGTGVDGAFGVALEYSALSLARVELALEE